MNATTSATLPRLSAPPPHSPRIPFAPILAFLTVWLGGSWTIVGTWLEPLLPGGWHTVFAVGLVGTLPVVTLVNGLRGRTYPTAMTRLLILRPFWYAMLFLPLLAGATLVGALGGLPFGASGSGGRILLAVGAAALTVAAIVGFVGSRALRVRQIEVAMPRLPAQFDGMRIAQISDLHVGPHTSTRFLARVAAAVQTENPDLIAITGDQVDDFAADVTHFNAAFGHLEAPLGVVAVAGNHDVYAGWEGVRRGLAAAGVRVLVNAAFAVEREGRRLWIAGTGDPAGAGRSVAPDIARTLAGIPADEPVVALAHNPALWPALARAGVDLTLSGHTHYGQFALPTRRWSLASAFLELAMGGHRQRHSLLYINPGTGFWGIPFRIGTPSEVTVLVLRHTEGEAGLGEKLTRR